MTSLETFSLQLKFLVAIRESAKFQTLTRNRDTTLQLGGVDSYSAVGI